MQKCIFKVKKLYNIIKSYKKTKIIPLLQKLQNKCNYLLKTNSPTTPPLYLAFNQKSKCIFKSYNAITKHIKKSISIYQTSKLTSSNSTIKYYQNTCQFAMLLPVCNSNCKFVQKSKMEIVKKILSEERKWM